MSLVVVSYPNISKSDFDLIQKIRRENDPIMFDVVNPHVTFVFPSDKLDIAALANHVRSKIGALKAIKVTFDAVKIVEDDSKTYFHTFLVPSKGFSEIESLHDLLYTDVLKSELRLDIPFIPHIGVGTSQNIGPMQKLAKDIEQSNLRVVGTLNRLTIAEYKDNKVRDIVNLSLAE